MRKKLMKIYINSTYVKFMFVIKSTNYMTIFMYSIIISDLQHIKKSLK